MNYTYEIIVNLSRFQVAEYFSNPHTPKKWFLKGEYEHLEGKPGQPGAKTIIRQRSVNTGPYGGSSTTEMIHTVIKNDLPYEYAATIEVKGVKQTSYNYFREETTSVTRWINRNEVELSGFAKITKPLTIRILQRQTQKIMRRFKKHAERAYASEI
ncbi:MAG: SRPBCC family protein [Candidatus Heimdallarchaeaceae archaeon]|jgi:hypothetical protein